MADFDPENAVITKEADYWSAVRKLEELMDSEAPGEIASLAASIVEYESRNFSEQTVAVEK